MSGMQPTIYLGLMSGTSLDGIDIAAVDFSNNTPLTIATETFAYDKTISSSLRKAIKQAGIIDTTNYAELDNQLGFFYGKLLNEFIARHKIDKQNIAAIGSHGHTLLHQPPDKTKSGYTLQIGNPNVITALTECKIVADFRRADMALGGHGAPLATAFHGAFLTHADEQRIVANIGGIANITLLDNLQVRRGFDTGPGNTLMNAYCMQYFSKAYDNNGELAATGTVNTELCSQLLADPYYALDIPKSTGPEYFNLSWLQQHLDTFTEQLSHQDMLASLCYVTAQSIADACLLHQKNTNRLLVCGGGVHNKTLINMLQNCLPYPVQSTAEFGLDPDYIEALAFAWMAKQRLHNLAANLPQVTGAEKACLLGAIYQI